MKYAYNSYIIYYGYISQGEKYMLDRLALILTIIGAVNWGSIGFFQFDLVAWLFGGQDNIISRIIFALVGLAGLWCVSLLFRERNVLADPEDSLT